jgi:hypothetical protein
VGAAVAAVALGVFVAGPPAAASARLTAVAHGTGGVTAATWSAIATQSSSSNPPAVALTLTFSLGLFGASGPQYFDVVNVGTHALSSTDYNVALNISGLLNLGNTTLTLQACTTPWSFGSCAGTTSTIGAWTRASGPVDSAVAPASPGSRLHVQGSVSNSVLSIATLTVTVTTSESSRSPRDLTSATTTNL